MSGLDSPPPPAPESKAFAAIVVAAGKGVRAGTSRPKQFVVWRGKPVLRHSVEALANAGAHPVVVAIADGAQDEAAASLDGIVGVRFIIGGTTRQESVRNALESLSSDAPPNVLIHDAARPILPPAVIERLVNALHANPGAIPVLPVVDSLAVADNGMMTGSARRENLRRVQTPQAFRFADILAAHRAWAGEPDAGDDAQVARAAGLGIALVEGDEALHKLTFAEDFMEATAPSIRIGSGYDVHRLAEGEDLWLCGIQIPHDRGLAGHSDADVAIHALVDAILGALGDGDIGQHFPPSDPKWRGAPSSRFLTHAVTLAQQAGYRIGNADLTIICEAPKIGPHRDAMRASLAALCATGQSAISVKATTTERLGFTGRAEGIAAQAVVSLLLAR
ncbi:MAG: bifunctional 2-C-methyl-D-erythritol 4-phosphate cytidylyltransferase/2-C-methyl-D-erythritol 2,4-cyclodiphosphate synthase [Novosphingobium sp.]|nr:bifunctional 2-C-methyl-D-erythritol 4-phosphate cytidylyltransferase/2-C-methyl-D-erythritol 2,4-cyclodiphosphate synthase [Novosphingobium sp.]